MFQDVSSEAVESTISVAQSHSSLFDDVYNSVSTTLNALKETVEEHPFASATLGLAVGAGMLYLTKGKLWGVASETSPFKWTNSLGLEKTIKSPQDPEFIEAIRRATRGTLVVPNHEPHFMRFDWLRSSLKPSSEFAIDRAKALRVEISPEIVNSNMFPKSPYTFPTIVAQGPIDGELAARVGKQMAAATKRFGV